MLLEEQNNVNESFLSVQPLHLLVMPKGHFLHPTSWSNLMDCPIGSVIAQSISPWHTVKTLSTPKYTCWNGNYDDCVMKNLMEAMTSSTSDEGGCTSPWVLNGSEWATHICHQPSNVQRTFAENYAMQWNLKEYCAPSCNSTFYHWDFQHTLAVSK